MFRVLERPAFSAAQSALFPIYFSLQTALPVILALTYPGSANPLGPASGLAGVLDDANRNDTLIPLAVALATGAANLLILLPMTQKIMADRRVQGEHRFARMEQLPLTRRREEGRQEELPRPAALAGDDNPQQALRQDARHLLPPQPGHLCRDRCLRLYSRRAAVVGQALLWSYQSISVMILCTYRPPAWRVLTESSLAFEIVPYIP